MTTAASSTSLSGRNDGGGRLQAILAIASMALAVAITVVLVASPASSAGPDVAVAPSAATVRTPTLPAGLRVEVQGGEAFDAYALGDRLAAGGASVRGVDPVAADDDPTARTTIVYYDLRSRAAAEQVRSMLGSGTLQRRQVFQPEVDVTIVLGKDSPRL